MTRRELIDYLKKFSYKPGSHLTVDEHPLGAVVRIKSQTPDVDNIKMSIILGMQCIIPLVFSRGEIEDAMYTLIRNMEMHELDEWFRFGGKPVHDPHPSR